MPTLTLESRPKNLKKLRAFVEKAARQAGLDKRGVYAVKLAVDEAASNIMEHGYLGRDDGMITCLWQMDEKALTITLLDNGRPFDLRAAPEPDLQSGLFERQTGGLGIHLIRQMMDEVHYQTSPQGNRLTLVKYRPQEA